MKSEAGGYRPSAHQASSEEQIVNTTVHAVFTGDKATS